jgi:hypothetical protein
MPKLSEDLVTGRMAPWRSSLYNLLNKQERDSLNQAYELEEKVAQEALMAKQKALKQEALEKEITKVNCSLESPKLVFTLADLSEDPSSYQPELIDFLRRHTGDDISLVGSSRLNPGSTAAWGLPISSSPNSKMNFGAKVKWTLASMEVIPANGKFTIIVTVPIE